MDIYRVWDGVRACLGVYPTKTTHKVVTAHAKTYMAAHGARDWYTGECTAALEHLGTVDRCGRFAGPGDRPSRLLVSGDRWAIAVEHDAVVAPSGTSSGILIIFGTVSVFAEQSSCNDTLAAYATRETLADICESGSVLVYAPASRRVQKHLAKN